MQYNSRSFLGRSIGRVAVLVALLGGTWATAQSAMQSDTSSQAANDDRRARFTAVGTIDREGGDSEPGSRLAAASVEAPAAFDNLTNGFDPQATYDGNREAFEEVETVADGLGPTYNAQSCRECHQNIVTGGASQVTEHRTGHVKDGQFYESPGGSLIQSRSTDPDAAEHVLVQEDIRTFRISTNTLGAGFVEAISNSTLLGIRDRQPADMRGTALTVPVLEANSASRIGRFGWKSQHASLESFSADAYLNEMGVTSPLLPLENTSMGNDMSAYDKVADPEDNGDDVVAFANFMRATKAPPRGNIDQTVLAGEAVFKQLGCATCHIPSITTAPAGTVINGGALRVKPAVGGKVIHPYSDFLLHDIGTGDGIPVLPTDELASTANQIRTAPLWGLRTRNRLMHDGLTFTYEEAVRRHGGQALKSRQAAASLDAQQRAALLAFLASL